eukprot:COSAG04_NODE_30796_length_260_cov_1.180124_1_plen_45_part_10
MSLFDCFASLVQLTAQLNSLVRLEAQLNSTHSSMGVTASSTRPEG